MPHRPYRDTPHVPTRLVAGHILFCREQTLGEAIDTGLLVQAELCAAHADLLHWFPYWLHPVRGWHWVQCGLQ